MGELFVVPLIRGTGFPPNSKVSVSFNGAEKGWCFVKSKGIFGKKARIMSQISLVPFETLHPEPWLLLKKFSLFPRKRQCPDFKPN
jgi:hypothetical protein